MLERFDDVSVARGYAEEEKRETFAAATVSKLNRMILMSLDKKKGTFGKVPNSKN